MSQRDYSWEQLELFAEIVTAGRFDRAIAMIVSGRHAPLDDGLSPESAKTVVTLLSRYREAYRAAPVKITVPGS